jgi:hypothetical protein
MAELRDRIERRIRDEICPTCRQAREGCHHREDDPCPLIGQLDQIIEVISSTRDYSLEPYQARIREIVCTACRQDESGDCVLRDEQQCALDTYFPRIVSLMEQEFAKDPGLT